MSDLDFRPERYRRPYRPRGQGPAERERSDWSEALPVSPWLALTLGVAAGAAVVYYMMPERAPGPRYRDSAPLRARRSQPGRHAVVGRTVTIARPRAEVYAYWRDPANLSFMENVERAEKADGEGRRQRWTIEAPGGSSVTLTTEITEERKDELIAWRSVEGSDVESRGRVEFRDAPGGRGTEVSAVIEYVPPGGTLGQLAAKLFQREPAIQVRHDLKRLKMLLETGEIATSQNRKNA